MRVLRVAIATCTCLFVAACHSAILSAIIRNGTDRPISLVEVDYPSASFGVQKLAPGEEYAYRFEVIGSGPTTLIWTDSAGHEQKSAGPVLHEGNQGSISITLNPGGPPTWAVSLTK